MPLPWQKAVMFNNDAAMVVKAAVPYAGPGDIETFLMWWGLRAYKNSVIGNAVADIFCVTANSTVTCHSLASGDMDTSGLPGGDTYHVSKLYDQTGNGKDITQTTDANRPVLILNSQNGKPTIQLNGSSQFLTKASPGTVAQPIKFSAVAKRTGNVGNYSTILASGNDNMSFYNASGHGGLYCGSDVSVITGLTESVFYAVQGYANGGSSTLEFDNTSNSKSSTGNAGSGGISADIGIGANVATPASPVNYLTGNVGEAGFSTSVYSTALRDNMKAYWGA